MAMGELSELLGSRKRHRAHVRKRKGAYKDDEKSPSEPG